MGLAIALVLNKDFWGKNGVKAVVLLPYMMAPVAVGLMWMLFYEPSSGLLNYIFTTVGLPRSALCRPNRLLSLLLRQWRRGR